MQWEIEQKAWVEDRDGLAAQLREDFGEPVHTIKKDRYFTEGKITSAKPGRKMRGRQVRVRCEGDKSYVTSKVRRWEGATEINQEYEFVVEEPEAFIQFITGYFGLHPLVMKVKVTEQYGSPGFLAELSHVEGLGDFLEVEILADSDDLASTGEAREKMDALFKKYADFLGPLEPQSYTGLLLERAAG